MNQPPEEETPPEPTDTDATDTEASEAEDDAVARRKAALRRFVGEHREWLDEMSQH